MKRLRIWLINYLTRNLLKAVTVDDILIVSGKDWLLKKRKLTAEEILLMKEDARSLQESLLWNCIKRELKYGVTLQRYDHAKTIDDTLFGKAMAYSISLVELFIERVGKL